MTELRPVRVLTRKWPDSPHFVNEEDWREMWSKAVTFLVQAIS